MEICFLFFSVVGVSGKPENIKTHGRERKLSLDSLLCRCHQAEPRTTGSPPHLHDVSIITCCVLTLWLHFLPEGYEAVVKLTLIICKVCGF